MKLLEHINKVSNIDSPIGDLANDILRDANFPKKSSETEMLDYINVMTLRGGRNDIFQELLIEYRLSNNETLNLILDYLHQNNITSLEKGRELGIATPYIEACGDLIKIPVANTFPENILNELEELETMNELHVKIFDGTEVQSSLLTKPNMSDGKNITFYSHPIQFEFLTSLVSRRKRIANKTKNYLDLDPRKNNR
ncbi:hypothetical protein BST97_03360 [Nonlabens spongiae]|uniref:YozE SAM-like domain-containing protein n=1 Tax=Nonlabens spongiae TaxID=331648 RepID=A0A1W6MHR7_9FLAO|nr:YozE family protein [Nonlabens spongiae]ARN77107.1 hypothetical protein BST97_03360 [Nonlabens spongiae]